jgi:hypothetical protein
LSCKKISPQKNFSRVREARKKFSSPIPTPSGFERRCHTMAAKKKAKKKVAKKKAAPKKRKTAKRRR